MAVYADFGDMKEDDRIKAIGEAAEQGSRVGVIVDDDDVADRYIKKLMRLFKVDVVARGDGPVNGTIAFEIARRPDA